MIHKIVCIKNVGKFVNTAIPFLDWDGTFRHENIIFAENGVGKSTLALIFHSLSGNDALLKRKKTFNSTADQEILLIQNDRSQFEYKNQHWNKHLQNIEIFDSNFIIENLTADLNPSKRKKENLFEVIIGKDGVIIKNRLDEEKRKITKLSNEKVRLKSLYKRIENNKDNTSETLKNEIDEITTKINNLKAIIREINIKLGQYTSGIIPNYMERVNYYLSLLCPEMQLKRLKNERNKRVKIILEIEGNSIYFTDAENYYTAKYVLSEADKNCIAFSLFLANIEKGISEKVIILDDPVSSYDHNRKNMTVNIIRRISKTCDQMFVFTHDINFTYLLSEKIYSDNFVSIKIENINGTSTFIKMDIKKECLLGVFKDITIAKNYLTNGAHSEIEKRDAIRCIRPILEGYFRIKYFALINDNEWLGDILGKIRQSDNCSPLFRLKEILPDLDDLNEYSKEWHHSSPNYIDTTINSIELKHYIKRLIDIIYRI